jgi:cytidylate kinase
MGSQGNELALYVAQQLGWQLVERKLINQAAVAAGVPHVALADIDELGLLNLRPSAREWEAYKNHVEGIIQAWAYKGEAVIVGRGGQMALRGWPDVFHIRIVAPLEMRVAHLEQKEKISAESARARLEASAKARARYLRRSYGVQLDDPTLYHLMINTGLLGLPLALKVTLQAFQTWSKASQDRAANGLRAGSQPE